MEFRPLKFLQSSPQLHDTESRAQHCEFDTPRDSLIRGKMVIGVNNKKVQERLLCEEDLGLEKTLHIVRAAGEAKEKTQEISHGSNSRISMQVDKICSRKHKSRKTDKTKLKSQQESDTDTDSELDYITRCKYCSLSNKYGRCPAYDQISM